jgi:hypothetical protein
LCSFLLLKVKYWGHEQIKQHQETPEMPPHRNNRRWARQIFFAILSAVADVENA